MKAAHGFGDGCGFVTRLLHTPSAFCDAMPVEQERRGNENATAASSEAFHAARNILVPTPAQDYIRTKAGTDTAQSRAIGRPETRGPVISEIKPCNTGVWLEQPNRWVAERALRNLLDARG